MARHTVRVEATADTYADRSNPNQNYGSATSLQTSQRVSYPEWGSPSVSADKVIYLNFPAPDIPDYKSIVSANIVLYCRTAALQGRHSYRYTHRINQSWTENGLTWNNRPSGTNRVVYVDTNQGALVSFDAMDYLSDIRSGQANNGVSIVLEDLVLGNGAEIRFDSREGANKPYLEVIYDDTPPLPPTGLEPNGESIQRGRIVTFSWTFNPIRSGDYQTRFDLQWSGNGGQTWNTITQQSQTTSYSMSTTSFDVGQVLWRVRTYDRYGQPSDWSNHATIEITGALAPTGLVPNGVHVNVEETIVFSWVFQSGVEGDVQTKFDLQWSPNGGQSWNTITRETADTSYTMPPNTLPVGDTVWRVRCYDSLNNQSAWSQQAFVSTFGAPATPVINMPNVITTANPEINWSTSDQQFAFEARVMEGNQLVWTSGVVFSALKYVTVGANLQNNTTYTARVRIQNQHNLWSDWATKDFVTEYAEPAQPIVNPIPKNGFIEVVVNNPTPGIVDYGFITNPATAIVDYGSITNPATSIVDYGSIHQATITHNDIYRREAGGDWIRIAANYEPGQPYFDYGVASGVVYEYKAVAFGITGGVAESEIESASIVLKGTWIHEADNPQGTAHVFAYVIREERGDNWQPDVELMQFAGRTSPIAEYGDAESYNVRFNLRLKNNADFEYLKKLIKSKKTLCYRDPRGRKVFGIFASLPFQDRFFGYDTSLEIVQTDYKEGV